MLVLFLVLSLALGFKPQKQAFLQHEGLPDTVGALGCTGDLVEFSGTYLVAPGGDGVARNGAWTTQTPDKVFDKDLGTQWNAGSGSNAELGWNVNNWFIFATSTATQPRKLNFITTGDNTHDPATYVLSTGDSYTGPWTIIANGSTAGATANWQSYPVTGVGAHAFFKLEFPKRFTQYQAYIREVSLSVCACNTQVFDGVTRVIPGSDGVAYNGGWSSGNQLGDKAFDGDLSTQWNAGSGDNAQSGWDVNNWIVFSTSTPVVASGVAFATAGDTTHDGKTFRLSGSASNKGPWNRVLSGNAQGGTGDWQSYGGAVSNGQAYSTWLLEFPTRQTRFQVYVKEIVLLVCACQSVYAPLTVRPGTDGTAYNGGWSNGNQLGDKAFDGDLNTQWNAGSGDNAQSGWNVPNWIIFRASRPILPRGLEIATAGDTTHDAKTWKLSYGDSFDGPWSVAGSGSAQAGTSALQKFSIGSDRPASYYKLEIPERYTQYQVYVKEIKVAGCAPQVVPYKGTLSVIPGGDGTSYNGAWTLGGAIGDKVFDGNLDTYWNSGSGDNAQTGWNVNNWIAFTSSTPLHLSGFAFASLGDTTHDPKTFIFSYSDSASGPWTVALAGTAQATAAWQSFNTETDNRPHNFFKLEFPSRYSIYQAVIREVKLNAWSY